MCKRTINNNKVIVVSGQDHHTTNIFIDKCKEFCTQVMSFSVLDMARQATESVMGNYANEQKYFQLLQDISLAINKYNGSPLKRIELEIFTQSGKTIIIETNEPDEIEILAREYNATKVLVARQGDEKPDCAYDLIIEPSTELGYSTAIFMNEYVLNN